MEKLFGYLQDHPRVVTTGILVFVAIHCVLAMFYAPIDIWRYFGQSENATGIYLGSAAAAALVAGFAGVVVIYGLTVSSKKFRDFRIAAGDRLKANWTSASASGFLAVAFFIAAAATEAARLEFMSPWLFEVGVLVLAHGALRVLWLLRTLVDTAEQQDNADYRDEQTVSIRDVARPRRH